MFLALIVVQWLHVFCGIFWFGGTLFIDFVVVPAVAGLSPGEQRRFHQRFGVLASRVVTPVAALAIVLGLVRGTVLGQVRSVDVLLGTTYGQTFLASFLAAIATYLWGWLVTGRQARRLHEIPVDERAIAEGKLPVAFMRQFALLRRVALLELIGFFAIFTCMILMRFGL